jgi:hypothetical protein
MLTKIYHQLFPETIRGKKRKKLFSLIRALSLYNIFNFFGLLVCKKYILIKTDTLNQEFSGKDIFVIKETTKDFSKGGQTLLGEDLLDLQPTSIEIETHMLDISESKFSFRNNHLVDENLQGVGAYQIAFDKLPIYTRFLSIPQEYEGIVAYLSDPTYLNYYHWMCGTLPLLETYQKYIPLEEIDYFYLGENGISNFHLESLSYAGVKASKILQVACTSNRILAAMKSRFIGFNDPISYSSFNYARNIFSSIIEQKTSKKGKKIYVKRGNVARRKVLNEDVILKYLDKYNFSIVQMDNKTIEEQAKVFSSSEIIIAPHGAALTNLLFVSPGTIVIEFFPNGYINNCFSVLANYAGAKHYYLQDNRVKCSNSGPHSLDIEVDIEKLDFLCREIGL